MLLHHTVEIKTFNFESTVGDVFCATMISKLAKTLKYIARTYPQTPLGLPESFLIGQWNRFK